MFNNNALNQYNYDTLYKYWTIRNLNVDTDVKQTILKNTQWYTKEFRIPDLDQFEHNYYINEYGIVFEKIPLGISSPFGHQTIHNYKDRQVLLKLNNGQISNVKFFYENDKYHYYQIDPLKSSINTITLVKGSFENVERFQQYNISYILVTDPLFRAR